MHDLHSGPQISTPQSRAGDGFEDLKMEEQSGSMAGVQYWKRALRCFVPRSNGVSRWSQRVWWLAPTFLQARSRHDPTALDKLHPSAFLDGMRGLAAFAVFLCHLSYGTWDIVHTYGSGPDENRWLLQLPVVRLFYSGPPMVAIFFVVSGYALSYKPIKLIRSRQREALLNATSSSIFRRALRLYLPCFVSTFMILCLVQLGLYDSAADFADNLRAVKESHMRSSESSMEQFWFWTVDMFNFVNIFDWGLFSGTTRFDPHLWTIPVEYRCSLLLFLTHILTARMSSKLRIMTVLFLCWWGLHWDRWDMPPFWCGQILAELHHIQAAEQELPLTEKEEKVATARVMKLRIPEPVYLIVFWVGCYLASFPDCDADLAPGFMWLNNQIPSYWSQKHRFWPNIGAAIIVWSGGNARLLRQAFASAPVQYLGQISFPLYVMHGPIIHTFGYSVMEGLYNIFDVTERWKFEGAFILAASLTIIATVWAADIFWRAVDTPCVKVSKWIEEKCLQS